MMKRCSVLLVTLMMLNLLPARARAATPTDENDMTTQSALITATAGLGITVGTVATVVNGVNIVRQHRGAKFWPVAGIVSGGVLLGLLTGAALEQGEVGYPFPQGVAMSLVFAGAGVGALVFTPRAEVALQISPMFQPDLKGNSKGLSLAGLMVSGAF